MSTLMRLEALLHEISPVPQEAHDRIPDLYNAYRLIHTNKSSPIWILRCIAQIARAIRQDFGLVAHSDLNLFYTVFEVLI